MKKLWYSYTKELKLASKSFYFYVEFVMAFLIIFILLFLIPEEMKSYEDEYLYLDIPEAMEEYYIEQILESEEDLVYETIDYEVAKDETIQVGFIKTEDKKIHLFSDLDTMVQATKDDRPIVGAHIWFDESINDLVYDYYIQGYESDRLQNLYLILHTKDLRALVDLADTYEVVELETGFEQLNSREMPLPSLLTFNGSLMGLFIIAAYIFLDKQEGVIKAYAVTSSKVWQYLMSKVLVMITTTIATTVVIAIAIMGTQPNYPMMILLLVTSSFAGSAFGLYVSSFFDTMTKAFGAIYVAMMLMMLPAIAYFIPGWEPLWINFIPSHFLIQGFKEIIIK
jgi:hypothetical protein